MYVLLTVRVVKVGTGSTERFAPRSTNRSQLHVSGPFSGGAAQKAAVAALATHTCLSAQLWSEQQVRDTHARGYGSNGADLQDALAIAARLLDAARQTMVMPPTRPGGAASGQA